MFGLDAANGLDINFTLDLLAWSLDDGIVVVFLISYGLGLGLPRGRAALLGSWLLRGGSTRARALTDSLAMADLEVSHDCLREVLPAPPLIRHLELLGQGTKGMQSRGTTHEMASCVKVYPRSFRMA